MPSKSFNLKVVMSVENSSENKRFSYTSS